MNGVIGHTEYFKSYALDDFSDLSSITLSSGIVTSREVAHEESFVCHDVFVIIIGLSALNIPATFSRARNYYLYWTNGMTTYCHHWRNHQKWFCYACNGRCLLVQAYFNKTEGTMLCHWPSVRSPCSS